MKLTYLFKKIFKKRIHRSNLGRQEFGWMKCFNVKYCGLVLFFLFCSQGSRCNILHIYGHLESRSLKITLLSNYANCIGGGLQQANNLGEEEDSLDILNRIFNSPLFESNLIFFNVVKIYDFSTSSWKFYCCKKDRNVNIDIQWFNIMLHLFVYYNSCVFSRQVLPPSFLFWFFFLAPFSREVFILHQAMININKLGQCLKFTFWLLVNKELTFF